MFSKNKTKTLLVGDRTDTTRFRHSLLIGQIPIPATDNIAIHLSVFQIASFKSIDLSLQVCECFLSDEKRVTERRALSMSKLRSGYRLVKLSLPTPCHFCERVEVMDPFINKVLRKCTHMQDFISTSEGTLAIMRGMRQSVSCLYSHSLNVSLSSRRVKSFSKPSFLHQQLPPSKLWRAARSGCRLLWKPGRAASGELSLPDARRKRREPGGVSHQGAGGCGCASPFQIP